MAATLMETPNELSSELVRNILDLAEYVEAGPFDPEHAVCKAEEFIEVVGLISALSDQDIDHTVTANLEVLHHFSGIRTQQAQHTQGPGRLAFDIIDIKICICLCLTNRISSGASSSLWITSLSNSSDVRIVKEDHQETHETE